MSSKIIVQHKFEGESIGDKEVTVEKNGALLRTLKQYDEKTTEISLAQGDQLHVRAIFNTPLPDHKSHFYAAYLTQLSNDYVITFNPNGDNCTESGCPKKPDWPFSDFTGYEDIERHSPQFTLVITLKPGVGMPVGSDNGGPNVLVGDDDQ
jgi:hypothetical protein